MKLLSLPFVPEQRPALAHFWERWQELSGLLLKAYQTDQVTIVMSFRAPPS